MIQIGGLVFKGRYEPAVLGTTMVFQGNRGEGHAPVGLASSIIQILG